MPNLKHLTFRVPAKFDDRRIWELMRRQVPKLVFANPHMGVNVLPPQEGEALAIQAQFANIPERTVVLGDKPAAQIVQELVTMGRFAGGDSRST